MKKNQNGRTPRWKNPKIKNHIFKKKSLFKIFLEKLVKLKIKVRWVRAREGDGEQGGKRRKDSGLRKGEKMWMEDKNVILNFKNKL